MCVWDENVLQNLKTTLKLLGNLHSWVWMLSWVQKLYGKWIFYYSCRCTIRMWCIVVSPVKYRNAVSLLLVYKWQMLSTVVYNLLCWLYFDRWDKWECTPHTHMGSKNAIVGMRNRNEDIPRVLCLLNTSLCIYCTNCPLSICSRKRI